jgi:hypothetical protein
VVRLMPSTLLASLTVSRRSTAIVLRIRRSVRNCSEMI